MNKKIFDVLGPCMNKLHEFPRQRRRLELHEPSICPILKIPHEILSIIIQAVPTECASVCALFWDVVRDLRRLGVLRQPTLLDQTRMAIRRQNIEDFKSILKKNLKNHEKHTIKYDFYDPGVVKFLKKNWKYKIDFKIPDPDLLLLANTPEMVRFLSNNLSFRVFIKFAHRFNKI